MVRIESTNNRMNAIELWRNKYGSGAPTDENPHAISDEMLTNAFVIEDKKLYIDTTKLPSKLVTELQQFRGGGRRRTARRYRKRRQTRRHK
jgi:hypothetical protein